MKAGGESQPGFPDSGPDLLIPRRVVASAAIGVLAMVGWAEIQDYSNRSGEVTVVAPIQQETQVADTVYRVCTWNMQNKLSVKLSELRKFVKTKDLDALMLQEVNKSDVPLLRQTLQTWGALRTGRYQTGVGGRGLWKRYCNARAKTKGGRNSCVCRQINKGRY